VFIVMRVLYFLIAHIATVAMAYNKPEDILRDVPSQLCTADPISEDVFTSLRVDSYCMQIIVVPEGQAAQLYVTNPKNYCGQLDEGQTSLAKITGNISTPVNLCASASRSFSLPTGTYYIGVSRTRIPLKVSLTYHNTNLGCNDVVDPSLVGVPLTFVPTARECNLILPGRTVLEIKNIRRRRAKGKLIFKNRCVRVRMGKRMSGLYWQWDPVCEIPANDFYEYDLGCGAVVMDASSMAIERVEFVLRPMDDVKAVIAPLMCSNDNDD
ncbi:hypothetical protein PMAYCL1PPCAC_31285, partial [Pristionchus mayeri]